MSKWFGTSWNAPCCMPETHVATPVGLPCEHCEEEFETGDDGFVIPVMTDPPREGYFHRACWLRSTIGSVGHQKCLCHCYGGSEEDPPGLSRREAAQAALAHYERRMAHVWKLKRAARFN
jgi:hypothetical protein